MIAAIYSRKSKFTGKGDSVENQVQMCKEYGEKILGITEFVIYEDEGFSGSNTNRPKFIELMADVKKKKFDVLICYRLDRISRNVADFSSSLELLQSNNIAFVSIKEQFDTSTPMGKAMIYIASVFAELERDTIAERIRDNMLELAKSGRWLGGQTPLGFESKKTISLDEEYKERTTYMLSPIDDELKLVKLIYEKYLEFNSLRKVNQYLLENNFKTKLGSDWNAKSISDLLQSPTYVKANQEVFDFLIEKGIDCIGKPNNKSGILSYNKKKGPNVHREKTEWIAAIAKHSGIIDADKWLKIQQTLIINKKNSPRLGKTHTTLLSGLLRCGKCGSPMTVIHGSKDKEGNKRFYYGCSLKVYSKGTRCDNSNVRSDEIESIVIDKLKNVTKDNGLLLEELKSVKNQVNDKCNYADELNLLKASLKSNEEAINNLVKQLAKKQSSIASNYIFDEIEKREKEINDTKAKLKALSENKSKGSEIDINIDLLIYNLKNFYSTIDYADIENKKYLISTLIDKISWNGSTGEVDIKLWGSPKKK
ncbi:recombinase family protein [Clostridium algidicarnis]|uniref:recombinase family protein n=1 Tax=Clostridium algidicarnis TaxID=37659 RepID=UPI001C0DC8D8|nr:recombinase family protein [Clostridium algidicarnis]MBU3193780.1 recombinase family protein [Clostridium algidicarnis]MBU3205366.1 recombinase family protein [Clostridium algidicarnis]